MIAPAFRLAFGSQEMAERMDTLGNEQEMAKRLRIEMLTKFGCQMRDHTMQINVLDKKCESLTVTLLDLKKVQHAHSELLESQGRLVE